MSRGRKLLLGAVAVVGVALVGIALALVVSDEPRPTGAPGSEAEALTSRVEAAVDLDAWARTGAVAWTFAGRNEHLWDRTRSFARVRFDDAEALLYVGGPRGVAYRGGREVHGDEAREILEQAHAAWINDAFWLNPLAKMRDDGVTRSVVRADGRDALLVSYSSGGLTPGDAYLWFPGDDGRPTRWKMWVSILPVGGVEVGWGGWQQLETGAWVSTRHEGPFGFTLELTDVRGAETLDALVDGPDPFAVLVGDDA